MTQKKDKEEGTKVDEKDYKAAYEECVPQLKKYQELLTQRNTEIIRLATIIARQEGALNG